MEASCGKRLSSGPQSENVVSSSNPYHRVTGRMSKRIASSK